MIMMMMMMMMIQTVRKFGSAAVHYHLPGSPVSFQDLVAMRQTFNFMSFEPWSNCLVSGE